MAGHMSPRIGRLQKLKIQMEREGSCVKCLSIVVEESTCNLFLPPIEFNCKDPPSARRSLV